MFEQLREIYSGKKVFLTGHTGFKGSWLLKIFNLLEAEVKGYALAPLTSNDLYHVINGDSLCTSVIADLRDKKRLVNEIVQFQPDFIFHLAAQPLVRLSYEMPSETFEINAIGTANVLDGLRKLGKDCFAILITTDKVYHNYEWLYPYRENDRLGGYDPYSASKACTELVIDSYRSSFFNVSNYGIHQKAIAVGRAGNVIGGGDWSQDRLLPDIARALGTGNTMRVRNPNAVRPWQHVLEPLAGYLQLGSKLSLNPTHFSQAYNFGPFADDALTVEAMVKLAIEIWGSGEFEFLKSDRQPHEAGLLKLDISKAIAELDWKPKFKAKKAVEMTVAWYKEFYTNREDIREFTEKQVRDFYSI
ncbi:MAG: rfbG [Segetibacter sp.]|nr:rfbG [Segetibacter sp.]